MAKVIDVSQGYDELSEKAKLHLMQRGRLPEAFITDALRAKNDLSGRASTVAYGGNTGTIRNISSEELEAEIKRRNESSLDPHFDDEDDLPNILMPDLDNPHSERLDEIDANREETAKTQPKRDAAKHKATTGPAVPTRGHPAADAAELTRHSKLDDDDEDDEDVLEDDESDEEEEGEAEDYSGEEWTKAALQTELESRELDASGNKKAMIQRLLESDASVEDEESDEED